MKTYSLAEVVAIALPEEWVEPERWLRRQLNAGRINGYRVGRTWRMSETHVRQLLNEPPAHPEPAPVAPDAHVLGGLSRRSRARIRIV